MRIDEESQMLVADMHEEYPASFMANQAVHQWQQQAELEALRREVVILRRALSKIALDASADLAAAQAAGI